MSVASPSAVYARRPGSADLPGGVPRTLADEHALLLGQVAARARELLAVVSRGGWPGAELAALAGYAQAEVLRHASDEETLLFPSGRSEAATRLARDHARLRAGIELLARAAAGEQLLSPGGLAAATRDSKNRQRVIQPRSGPEIKVVFTWLQHARIAALMAVHADVLGQTRGELAGIHN